MKKLLIFFGLVALVVPLVASAAVFGRGQNYALPRGESVASNLYAFGGSVTISGSAREDVMTAGGTIIFTGSVAKDLSAVGGTINLSGDVSGDTRLAGGTIILAGKSEGELLAAGGQLTIASGAEVSGETYLAGGSVLADGRFAKKLTIAGGTVVLGGVVEGDVKVTASKSLTISSSAVIRGNLEYSSPKPATIESGAKIGGVTNYKKLETPKTFVTKGGRAIFGAAWLVKTLMMLLAALVVCLLLKKQTQQAVRYIMPNFGKELLRGFIILVVLPIAIIISFVTIVGAILGAGAAFLYIVMAIFGAILSQIAAGALISKFIFKQANYEGDWKSAIIGSLALAIVCLIPFVGGLVCFVFFLAAFGALFNFLYKNFRET